MVMAHGGFTHEICESKLMSWGGRRVELIEDSLELNGRENTLTIEGAGGGSRILNTDLPSRVHISDFRLADWRSPRSSWVLEVFCLSVYHLCLVTSINE
jgi:hypothetical protein